MLHEQKDVQPASGAEVRDLDPNSFGDQVFAVLKQYDDYIEQEPKTFEQHFARMQMAFSAFILFNCHVLQPLLYNKEFSRLYHKSFTLRYVHFPYISFVLLAVFLKPYRG
ncbi:hypothetical protein BDN72DRAFT_64413 [Pluteus cervinus]|uniref:Uncharacterized protein n=1 Tax=Pluteus cervinus TaxID=181527 RepID=A0ACD3AQT7_9AGAR|nr:hypothetical protein BDN72DRAFT_64413 [Pluteus cervinus]